MCAVLVLTICLSYGEAYNQFQFDRYALHRINVINVIEKKVIENQTIVIENDTIKEIVDSNDFNNDSIKTLNYEGHYIIPGLIDAHVHFGTDPSQSDNLEITKDRLHYLLKNGITSVRDMAGDARFLSYVSRQASLDEIPSPDIYYSALIAGETFFKDPRTKLSGRGYSAGKAPWMRGINAKSDLHQIISEAKGTGATGIKIYANLDKTYIENIVKEAHKQGFKVWAHSTVFPAKPSEVCGAGVDVVSHASYLGWEMVDEVPSDASNRRKKVEQFDSTDPVFTDLIEMMKSKGTIIDPTIAIYKRSFPDSTLFNYGVLLTKLAYENGVKVGIGTDQDIKDFRSDAPIFQEMEVLLNDVGLKPIDLIESATIINAQMLAKEDEIGSIEKGKKANLVILKRDPTADINNMKNPVMVIKNGKLYNSN